jgi:hypothetical protein
MYFRQQGATLPQKVGRSIRKAGPGKLEIPDWHFKFVVAFDAIKQLIADDQERKAKPKRRIGFL